MKILALLSRFPWPIEKGDKLRAYYQLKGLAKDHEVHLICLNDKEVDHKSRAELDFCESVTVIPQSLARRGLNLLTALINGKPFQVNYFHSPAMKKAVARKIGEAKIDVCYVQLIRLGMNLPFGSETGWFLDYMDAFSLGMERRIAQAGWLVRPFVRSESRRLRRYEREIASHFDGLSIISGRDAEALPGEIVNRVHIIPNGVGEDFFEAAERAEKTYDLIFFGNMGYHPNVQSAMFLLNEVMPELQRRGRALRLCIAGARPAPQIRAHHGGDVEVTGFVSDLRSFIRRSRLAIAPLVAGQGLQNKLLESMAMGVPTLTTPLANSALHARAGEEIMVCESPAEFADAIAKLLDHPEEAAKLGEKGREFVERNYRWEQMNAKLEAALKQAAR